MRILVVAGWLMIPVLVGAYHYGPGQERLALDHAAVYLARAQCHAADGAWAEAVENYDHALKLLPADRVQQSRRIRLERAKAQMMAQKLPEANQDLAGLVEELKLDPKADPNFLAEARDALANSQYYMTWLMRLEGEPQTVWEPEVEAARQSYRLLAEEAEARGDETAAQKHREDLEATIRLARMDLGDLQGLPLPSQ